MEHRSNRSRSSGSRVHSTAYVHGNNGRAVQKRTVASKKHKQKEKLERIEERKGGEGKEASQPSNATKCNANRIIHVL